MLSQSNISWLLFLANPLHHHNHHPADQYIRFPKSFIFLSFQSKMASQRKTPYLTIILLVTFILLSYSNLFVTKILAPSPCRYDPAGSGKCGGGEPATDQV
ncbi:hypothetical protein OIU79_002440 [Salix purpurea]|uniref:Uncharacterized protein n=1 Tax=Salix purpurea TaxID=77065 RepID=A0A9Q0ZI64_SALPP|nr:hypothetical protein OIU79_002440 [Salix purpurea]